MHILQVCNRTLKKRLKRLKRLKRHKHIHIYEGQRQHKGYYWTGLLMVF